MSARPTYCTFAAFLATAAVTSALAQQTPPPTQSPTNRDVRHLVVLSPGPNWQSAKPLNEQAHLSEHLAYYRALIAAGKVHYGGPYLRSPGHGLVIPAEGVSESDALEFARADPAVRGGVLVFAMQPWLIALKRQDHYHETVAPNMSFNRAPENWPRMAQVESSYDSGPNTDTPSHAATSVRPNHSLEPTRYGRQRKPGPRYCVHCLSPGLRCLPPRAAQLER